MYICLMRAAYANEYMEAKLLRYIKLRFIHAVQIS